MEDLERIVLDFTQMRDFAEAPFLFGEGAGIYLTGSMKLGKIVERAAKERGLPVRAAANFLAFAPPLVVTRTEIDAMWDVLADSLEEARDQLQAGVVTVAST